MLSRRSIQPAVTPQRAPPHASPMPRSRRRRSPHGPTLPCKRATRGPPQGPPREWQGAHSGAHSASICLRAAVMLAQEERLCRPPAPLLQLSGGRPEGTSRASFLQRTFCSHPAPAPACTLGRRMRRRVRRGVRGAAGRSGGPGRRAGDHQRGPQGRGAQAQRRMRRVGVGGLHAPVQHRRHVAPLPVEGARHDLPPGPPARRRHEPSRRHEPKVNTPMEIEVVTIGSTETAHSQAAAHEPKVNTPRAYSPGP
jgi:hypothetical protein